MCKVLLAGLALSLVAVSACASAAVDRNRILDDESRIATCIDDNGTAGAASGCDSCTTARPPFMFGHACSAGDDVSAMDSTEGARRSTYKDHPFYGSGG
jgi:predicted lipoprotein with Yx(FWY)xxD motif